LQSLLNEECLYLQEFKGMNAIHPYWLLIFEQCCHHGDVMRLEQVSDAPNARFSPDAHATKVLSSRGGRRPRHNMVRLAPTPHADGK
jgi:hypothetical protein